MSLQWKRSYTTRRVCFAWIRATQFAFRSQDRASCWTISEPLEAHASFNSITAAPKSQWRTVADASSESTPQACPPHSSIFHNRCCTAFKCKNVLPAFQENHHDDP